MDNKQAQNANNILNHLCKFINNKPVALSRIARDLKLDIHDVETIIREMMDIHTDWYSVTKKMWSGNAVMLNGPALKEIHKFLVLGGYSETANTAAVAVKAKEVKPEEKAANARNTVIIKPRLDLNHS